MSRIIIHPLRDKVLTILKKHFSNDIVKRFRMDFEAEIFNKGSINIWRQLKDNVHVLEVRYQTGHDTFEYICDVTTLMTSQQAEYWLLKCITDKYKEGKIRFADYKFNPDIEKGTYETRIVKTPRVKDTGRRIN